MHLKNGSFSNDTRGEVDISHISVELALVSTDTRITILSNDMDLCREKWDSYVGWLVNGGLVTIEVALT